MDNPFRFGAIVTGERFADREDEIRDLSAALASGQNVILSSPRRYGKSSLLLETFGRLKRRGILCVYVDLFRIPGKKRFAEVYSSALAREALGPIQKWVRTLREWIPLVVPKVILRGDEVPELEFEVARHSSELDPVLERIIDLPERLAAKRGKRMVVALDEFQEVLSWNGDDFQKLLRARIQHHHRVAYCFLGSKRQLIGRMFLQERGALYRAGKMMSLDRIPRDRFKEFILARFRTSGFKLSGTLVERVLDLTECHPYYTQLLSYELWNRLAAGLEAEEKTLLEAVEVAIAGQSYAYTLIWEAQPALRQNLLRLIAEGRSSRLMSQEAVQRYGLGSPSSVRKNLSVLERDEVLERREEGYAFVDLFFREWLRQRPG